MRREVLQTAVLAGVVFLSLGAQKVEATEPILRIAVGENKPPYIVSDPPGGIEYDLLSLIVKGMGYSPQLIMVPNTRAQEMLRRNEVDGAISTSGEFLSEPYIAYQNVAISLQARGLSIRTIADLSAYRVAAFQSARLFLGPEFQDMAAKNSEYQEVSPQVIANRLLFTGRTDVVISDINIFYDLDAQTHGSVDTQQRVSIHRIFPPTRYRMVFLKASLRDAFNRSLAQVLIEDPYPALARKYLAKGSDITFRP